MPNASKMNLGPHAGSKFGATSASTVNVSGVCSHFDRRKFDQLWLEAKSGVLIYAVHIQLVIQITPRNLCVN